MQASAIVSLGYLMADEKLPFLRWRNGKEERKRRQKEKKDAEASEDSAQKNVLAGLCGVPIPAIGSQVATIVTGGVDSAEIQSVGAASTAAFPMPMP